jgi:hypothetical protein
VRSSFWSREKDVELAARYTDGESVDQIAADFGLTPSAIVTRCSTLGLLRRRTSKSPNRYGNAHLLIGEALRQAIPVDPDEFSSDLLDSI